MKEGTVAVGFLHGGEWSACFGMSLVELYLVDATIGSHRLVRQLPKFCAAGGLVAGRNEVAEKFLDATDCEWLWMVDSDMGFGPTTVDDLISAADPDSRPVVGGLCFALRANGPGMFHGEKYVIVPSAYRWVETADEVGFQSILDLPADGGLMEVSLRQSLKMSHDDVTIFFTRPIAATIMGIVVVIVLWPLLSRLFVRQELSARPGS